MACKRRGPKGCGCGCGCLITCPNGSSQVVCKVTFNLANLPDPMTYWRAERIVGVHIWYRWRKITITGFGQLNGSYITTRGADCVWQNRQGSFPCTYTADTYPVVAEYACPDTNSSPESYQSGDCNVSYKFELTTDFNQFHDVEIENDIPELYDGRTASEFPDLRPTQPVADNYFPCGGTTNLEITIGGAGGGNGGLCQGTGSSITYTGSNAVSSATA